MNISLFLIGAVVVIINFDIYNSVHPLTFYNYNMKWWNVFHLIMIIIGIGLIVCGFLI